MPPIGMHAWHVRASSLSGAAKCFEGTRSVGRFIRRLKDLRAGEVHMVRVVPPPTLKNARGLSRWLSSGCIIGPQNFTLNRTKSLQAGAATNSPRFSGRFWPEFR